MKWGTDHHFNCIANDGMRNAKEAFDEWSSQGYSHSMQGIFKKGNT